VKLYFYNISLSEGCQAPSDIFIYKVSLGDIIIIRGDNLLGETIKEYRNKKGFTQKELAEFLGISYSYLTKIETNNKVPSPDLLVTIEFLLDIPGNLLDEYHDSEYRKASRRIISLYLKMDGSLDNMINQERNESKNTNTAERTNEQLEHEKYMQYLNDSIEYFFKKNNIQLISLEVDELSKDVLDYINFKAYMYKTINNE